MSVYQYWTPMYSREHYLSATEIAQSWGLYSKTGNVHTRLVSAALTHFCETNDIEIACYETRQGLMKVYPSVVYTEVYYWLKKRTNYFSTDSISIDNQRYFYNRKDDSSERKAYP